MSPTSDPDASREVSPPPQGEGGAKRRVGGGGALNYDARVRANFVDADDRLVSIPAQHKKRMAILRWLAEDFQPGRRYAEGDVNRIISRRHPDFATLRRYLVDEELMQRHRSIYWRTGTVPNTGHDPSEFPGLDS